MHPANSKTGLEVQERIVIFIPPIDLKENVGSGSGSDSGIIGANEPMIEGIYPDGLILGAGITTIKPQNTAVG